MLCKVLRVNRSTYYKHFDPRLSPREKENQEIRRIILEIYSDYDNSIGAYSIAKVLSRDYGINISVGRVYRLMNAMNLPKPAPKKPKITKHQANGECDNHLHQEFNQKAPNTVWASDFTYIRVNGSWYYLCVVMDLFSRKIVGWHISNKHDVNLTMTAFKKAYAKRDVRYGLIFHSDQGSEYTAYGFRRLLSSLGVVQSFSKKGYPYDNACRESFFKYLKARRVKQKTYHSLEELRLDIFDYIENEYNNRRPHCSLGYKTPNEVEANYWDQQA